MDNSSKPDELNSNVNDDSGFFVFVFGFVCCNKRQVWTHGECELFYLQRKHTKTHKTTWGATFYAFSHNLYTESIASLNEIDDLISENKEPKQEELETW